MVLGPASSASPGNFEKQILHPIPTESETLGLGPTTCVFTSLPGVLMHDEVGEPLN